MRYPILLLMCFRFKLSMSIQWIAHPCRSKGRTQWFPIIILSKFHSNHPFTVDSHLTFYICKFICQYSPRKVFDTTAMWQKKLIIDLPPSLELYCTWRSLPFTKMLHGFMLEQNTTSKLLLHKFSRLTLKLYYNSPKEDQWNLFR